MYEILTSSSSKYTHDYRLLPTIRFLLGRGKAVIAGTKATLDYMAMGGDKLYLMSSSISYPTSSSRRPCWNKCSWTDYRDIYLEYYDCPECTLYSIVECSILVCLLAPLAIRDCLSSYLSTIQYHLFTILLHSSYISTIMRMRN